MTCPIPNCVFHVAGSLRMCRSHYAMVPRPQQEALNHYARIRKGGPSHRASFARAVESVCQVLEARKIDTQDDATLVVHGKPAWLPYRDD